MRELKAVVNYSGEVDHKKLWTKELANSDG